ncbi:MAG: uridine kinase, partial [Jatrophihabitans sp.]
PSSAVLVCGAFLADLPFDLTVALTMAPAALRRHTPEDQHWTLPAHGEYRPTADVLVKLDDPRHPAVRSR